MTARGSFEIELTPQNDEEAPAGRMLISKSYSGDLMGKGIGQMLSKRTQLGASAYFAIEEFSGTLNGKLGSFTLLHNAYMSALETTLDISVLSGSGTGELENITGSLDITQNETEHQYVFSYKL